MTQKGVMRAYQAAERRFQREAQKRRRALERQAKEAAKLSALEQARLEVATHENQLDLLLSIHKEPCEDWDWLGLAATVRPHPPSNSGRNEMYVRQLASVCHPQDRVSLESAIEQNRRLEEQAHLDAKAAHDAEVKSIEELRELALRVLAFDHMAYLEAFAQFNPIAEFSNFGALKQFAVETDDLIACEFKVNSDGIVPREVKTLTSSGKVSVKPMSRTRFHEIYQDYVCGCVFRMAREVFAMLPVDQVLVNALADLNDPDSQQSTVSAVLSVAFSREVMARIDFEETTPTNAIELFPHRGDFKASRKSGAFQPITPLSPADLQSNESARMDFSGLLTHIRELRGEIGPPTGMASAATA